VPDFDRLMRTPGAILMERRKPKKPMAGRWSHSTLRSLRQIRPTRGDGRSGPRAYAEPVRRDLVRRDLVPKMTQVAPGLDAFGRRVPETVGRVENTPSRARKLPFF
jgi:hypothetical protein